MNDPGPEKDGRQWDLNTGAWAESFCTSAARFGLHVTGRQALMFARHAAELERWNNRINLTAVRSPGLVARRHFLDSIAVLKFRPLEGRVLDVGTGGGFPGLALKVMCPAIDLVMIDAVAKKVSFIKHVVRTLGLGQTAAHHLRAEQMAGESKWQGAFDVVVSRAVGSVARVAALARPLLASRGCLLVWKSARWRGQEKDWPAGAAGNSFTASIAGTLFSGRSYSYLLDGESEARRIVELSI